MGGEWLPNHHEVEPSMKISAMTENDLARVVKAWNATLPHDQLTDTRFRWVMLEDPNYEPDGLLLAEAENGSLLGLSACVLRRTVEGKDGGGAPDGFKRGYLKGFFVTDLAQAEEAADRLLDKAEARCREGGKTELCVTQYTGPYIFPGLDVRYERLRELLGSRGFRDVQTIEDVGITLGPELESDLERTRERAGHEVEVVTWRPDLMPMMRKFVAEGQQPQWFPVGWEEYYAKADDTKLMLRRGKEIIGWAHFHPGEQAGFGPTLVLERERGKGYGARLLFECMVRAMHAGAKHMSAGWANTGFYVSCGWQIERRFAVLIKAL